MFGTTSHICGLLEKAAANGRSAQGFDTCLKRCVFCDSLPVLGLAAQWVARASSCAFLHEARGPLVRLLNSLSKNSGEHIILSLCVSFLLPLLSFVLCRRDGRLRGGGGSAGAGAGSARDGVSARQQRGAQRRFPRTHLGRRVCRAAHCAHSQGKENNARGVISQLAQKKKMFRKILPHELLLCRWTREDKFMLAPNVIAATNNGNV